MPAISSMFDVDYKLSLYRLELK